MLTRLSSWRRKARRRPCVAAPWSVPNTFWLRLTASKLPSESHSNKFFFESLGSNLFQCLWISSLPYDSIDVHVRGYNNSPLDTTTITRKVLDQTKDIRKHALYDKDLRVNCIRSFKLNRSYTELLLWWHIDQRHCHSEAGKGTHRGRAGRCSYCAAIEHDAHLRRIGRSRRRLGRHQKWWVIYLSNGILLII